MPLFSFLQRLLAKIKQKKQSASRLDQKLLTSLTPWRFPRLREFKLLPRFLSKSEKWLLHLALAIVVIAIFAVGGLVLTNPSRFAPKEGGTLHEGVVGFPKFINPALSLTDADRDLAYLIYSSLLRYDENGELIKDLAENFEINENETVYTFYLKDALWHDGEPVRAEDIIFTIQAVQNPLWRSPFWRSFQGVQAKALDDKTIVFELEKPFGSFPHLLTIGILPKHIWQKVDPANITLTVWNIKPVGSGPWQFSKLNKTKEGRLQSYTLEKNKNYYGEKSWLEKITFYFFENQETANQALKVGKIDSLNFGSFKYQEMPPSKKTVLLKTSLPAYTAVFFNSRRNEFLETKEIRQALSLFINKKALAESFKAAELLGPMPADFLEQLPESEFDAAKANELLEKAGFAKTDFWQKNDKALAINLVSLNEPYYYEIAVFFKEAWEKQGVKTELILLDPADFKKTIKAREYEALIWTQIIGRDPDILPFWHSSQINGPGLNLTSFRNRQADILLEELRDTSDTEKRKTLYRDFQNIITEEAPAVFLFQPSYFYAVSKKIKGVSLGKPNSPSDRFAGLKNWHIKTKLNW